MRDSLTYSGIALILILMIAAVVVSKRRNRLTIEAFNRDDLTTLKMCLRDWMVPRVEKRLAKLGWKLVSEEPAQRGISIARFERKDDETALPLSQVLHRLNKWGFLPAGSMNLRPYQEEAE
ncbi:MAG: hypothetical protein J2O44_03115 [Porphyrobacter sp.]|nr:hypothetical protein [Porphyrobacter sp.]